MFSSSMWWWKRACRVAFSDAGVGSGAWWGGKGVGEGDGRWEEGWKGGSVDGVGSGEMGDGEKWMVSREPRPVIDIFGCGGGGGEGKGAWSRSGSCPFAVAAVVAVTRAEHASSFLITPYFLNTASINPFILSPNLFVRSSTSSLNNPNPATPAAILTTLLLNVPA